MPKFLNDKPFHMNQKQLDRFYRTMYIESNPLGCWIATTYLDKDGYASFYMKGHKCRRHRVAYEHFTGQKAHDMLDHYICDNPACCNPEHLRVSTSRENTLRSKTAIAALNAQKTECINGHSLHDAYVYFRKRRNTYGYERRCKVCVQIRNAEKAKKIREGKNNV